jgi:hypothetical protein
MQVRSFLHCNTTDGIDPFRHHCCVPQGFSGSLVEIFSHTILARPLALWATLTFCGQLGDDHATIVSIFDKAPLVHLQLTPCALVMYRNVQV